MYIYRYISKVCSLNCIKKNLKLQKYNFQSVNFTQFYKAIDCEQNHLLKCCGTVKLQLLMFDLSK